MVSHKSILLEKAEMRNYTRKRIIVDMSIANLSSKFKPDLMGSNKLVI